MKLGTKSQVFFIGRAPTLLARALVFTTCLTLVFSGVMVPGTGRAQTEFLPDSLKDTPRPEPTAAVVIASTIDDFNTQYPLGDDLPFNPLDTEIVKDQAALIALGKALFWDMQLGSDGIQSCATCHFNAGADVRSKNQIAPGILDKNFLNNPLDGGTGDTRFGNSTAPFTANDPNNPVGPIDPPDPAFNVPGKPGFNPNYQLVPTDFPLNGWFNPTELVPRGPGVNVRQELALVDSDTNDAISSQGVRRTQFVSVTPGKAVDKGTPLPDIWNLENPGQLSLNKKVRRVEPRNAPTVINAVFNFDNFWDGRASFIFNGVNPFGFRDRASTLKMNLGDAEFPDVVDVFIRITNSSLASQAVGPPGSDFEMSWAGRTFPDIGKKMLSMQPLAKQKVHFQDSVLGPYTRGRSAKGLYDPVTRKKTTYTKMIQDAFQDQWWNSPDIIVVEPGSPMVAPPSPGNPRTAAVTLGKTRVVKAPAAPRAAAPPPLAANEYTQMMFNFSLFFGLAVQAYEATLISDDTPFDRFSGATSLEIPPDPTALTDQEQLGLAIFSDPGPDNDVGVGSKCNNCHILPITTGHTVLDMKPDAQGVPMDLEGIIEDMVMGNGEMASYDHGMYNISVRRTEEDIGRAGTAPDLPPFQNPEDPDMKPFPLSYVELVSLRQSGLLPDDVARFVPDTTVLDRLVTRGAFKVPNIRNALYTGPYLHNGDSATLRQVVEFYVRGGNFPNTNFNDLTVDIEGIAELRFPEFDPVAKENVDALVAFLANALTDERVAFEKAPFDHPQLFVPNGATGAKLTGDKMLEIKAVGAGGRPPVKGQPNPIPRFLNLDPNLSG